MHTDYPDIIKGISTQDGVLTSFTISQPVDGFEPWSSIDAKDKIKIYARNSTQHITAVCDFNGTALLDNITVLKSSAGAGNMPNWTVADDIYISFTVLDSTYSSFLDFLGDKSVLEPVYGLGFGQSKMIPYTAADTGSLPDNPNVESWDSDGSAVAPAAPVGYHWRQCDPNATPADDYDFPVTDGYIGHPRQGRGGVMLGWADFVQRFRGGKVKIFFYHWGGANLGQSFNPWVDLPPIGTGYKDVVEGIAAALAADTDGMPSTPDFFLFRSSWSDRNLIWIEQSYYMERYFNLKRAMVKGGFLAEDTPTVLFGYEDEVHQSSASDWNPMETLASIDDNAILVPMEQSPTTDGLHKAGNQQILDGVKAAKACIFQTRQKYLAPGQLYVRPTKNLQFWAEWIAPAASQPTNLTAEFNTDNATPTVVRFPFAARDASGAGDTSYGHTHLDQVRAIQQIDSADYSYRFHVEEEGTPANFCDYMITGESSYSDPTNNLPQTVGQPNNAEFPCTVTTGGTWPPAGGAGTECVITLQRWNGSSWEDATVYADDGSERGVVTHTMDVRFATQDKQNQPVGDTKYPTFLGTSFGAGQTPIVRVPALVRQDGLLDSLGTTKIIMEGRSSTSQPQKGFDVGGQIYLEDTTVLGVLDGTFSCVGRRTDVPADDAYYSAKFDFSANFHTSGNTNTDIHIHTEPTRGEDTRTWPTTNFVIANDVDSYASWNDVPAQTVIFYASDGTDWCYGKGTFDGVDTISSLTIDTGTGTPTTSMPDWNNGADVVVDTWVPYSIVDPSRADFEGSLGPVRRSFVSTWNWPNGVSTRTVAFALPGKTGETWAWDWMMEGTFREN